MGGLVDHQNIVLPCFLLAHLNMLSRLDAGNILDLQSQQIAYPQAVVDPHGEKQEITG